MRLRIFYVRPEFFPEFMALLGNTPSADKLAETHIELATVDAPFSESHTGNALEWAFAVMQGECWSPNGEARDLINAKGLGHTSMSVGDVVVEERTGDAHAVADSGFKRIGNIGRPATVAPAINDPSFAAYWRSQGSA